MNETRKIYARHDYVGSIQWEERTACEGEDTLYSAFVEDGSRLTVLDRMTGFDWGRDIETGFRDSAGKFWLASCHKDIRTHPELTIAEAIEWVKERANNCVGV